MHKASFKDLVTDNGHSLNSSAPDIKDHVIYSEQELDNSFKSCYTEWKKNPGNVSFIEFVFDYVDSLEASKKRMLGLSVLFVAFVVVLLISYSVLDEPLQYDNVVVTTPAIVQPDAVSNSKGEKSGIEFKTDNISDNRNVTTTVAYTRPIEKKKAPSMAIAPVKKAKPVVAAPVKIAPAAMAVVAPTNYLKSNAPFVTPKINTVVRAKKVAANPVAIENSFEMTSQEFSDIIDKLENEKSKTGSKFKGVQVRKSKYSNVANAYKLAPLLQKRGFYIAGREPWFKEVDGVDISSNEFFWIVTFGKVPGKK
jgi:hypothetical protein